MPLLCRENPAVCGPAAATGAAGTNNRSAKIAELRRSLSALLLSLQPPGSPVRQMNLPPAPAPPARREPRARRPRGARHAYPRYSRGPAPCYRRRCRRAAAALKGEAAASRRTNRQEPVKKIQGSAA
eukprot:scaffold3473_cov122-Isochrysis_galbana.AAC.11